MMHDFCRKFERTVELQKQIPRLEFQVVLEAGQNFLKAAPRPNLFVLHIYHFAMILNKFLLYITAMAIISLLNLGANAVFQGRGEHDKLSSSYYNELTLITDKH